MPANSTSEVKFEEGDQAGLEKAASWHEGYAHVLRNAIHTRKEMGIGYGELLYRAEIHEGAAESMRTIIKDGKAIV